MNEPELIPQHAHRALLYIERLNSVGVRPTSAHVELFATSTGPREAQYDSPLTRSLQTFASQIAMASVLVRAAEPVVAWLVRLAWVEESDDTRLTLTDVGRAFLAAMREKPPEWSAESASAAAVVLRPDDPFVYSQLTRTIDSAGEALLVDPYFKADMLPWLHDATRVSRLLMSREHGQAREVQKAALVLYEMRETANAGRVEVRATNAPELHDRCVIPPSGAVLFLGTSITGIGLHLSTIVPMPTVAGDALRKELERVWDSADPVEPLPLRRPDESDAESLSDETAS
jgi:hypothetical protein